MKKKTNISVQDVRGIRRTPDLILGDKVVKNVSGDIMDANATEELVNDKIAEVIGTAPEILDTLGEIVQELETKADKSDLEDYVAKDEIEESLEDKDITVNSITAKEINKDLSDVLISTIHIDESHSETGSKVVITGDLGKDAESAETNVIKWIRDNSKLYIGRYSEKLHYLAVMAIENIEDYDSDWATNKLYNQYMKLPKFWYKCTNTEVGADIQFTHDESVVDDSWNCWEGDTFIATYKAHAEGHTTELSQNGSNLEYVQDITLTSRPDVKPSTNISWMQFRDITRKMGKGFSMVTYDAHKIMEILFYAWYGEVDAQLICGAGANVSDWHGNKGEHENGRTMDMVSDFTDTNAEDEPNNNHFWGLCDWWGNVYEWIDNLQVLGYDSNNQIEGEDARRLSILDYNGNPVRVFNNIGYVDDCQTKKIWGKNADVIPIETQGTDEDYYDTGYTVYGCIYTGFGYVGRRSNGSDDAGGGVGCLDVDYDPDIYDSNYGSRLQYTGAWAEVSELYNYDYAFIGSSDITTIKIDESNSDASNKVKIEGATQSGVIGSIKNASKLYIGKYNTDYNKMLLKPFDGSDTSWEGMDGASLYMCLPEFWYKCYNTSYGCDVSFTMNKEYTDGSWNHWDGKTLIACYKAQLAGDSDNVTSFDGDNPVLDGVYFESKPNSKPSTKFSQKQGKQIARNMGDGFSLVTYEEHKIMQLLFYAYYGNVDAQAVCGAGASVSNWDSNSHINGRVMDRITNLNDTVASNNPTCNHFWGLCDWWGNVYEWVDNIQILGMPTGDEEEAINVAILDKDGKIVRIVTVPYCDGAITKMAWGKYADVIPAAADDSYDEISDAGYTDYGSVSSDFGYIAWRSSGSDDSNGGVGDLGIDDDPDNRCSDRGSRLSYSGEWAITSELEP